MQASGSQRKKKRWANLSILNFVFLNWPVRWFTLFPLGQNEFSSLNVQINMRSLDDVFSLNSVIWMIFEEANVMSLNIHQLLNEEMLVRVWFYHSDAVLPWRCQNYPSSSFLICKLIIIIMSNFVKITMLF